MQMHQQRHFKFLLLWSVLVVGAAAVTFEGATFGQRPANSNGLLPPPRRGLIEPVPARPGLLEPAPSRRGLVDSVPGFRNVAQQAFPGIVSIETFGRGSGSCRGPGPIHNRGSGFAIGPGNNIVTSSRVVSGADRVRIRLFDGTTYLASSVTTDPLTDLAVLRFSPLANLPVLPLADSNATAIGDWVLSVGNAPSPYLYGNEQVAAGVVSSYGPGPGAASREDFMQTDISSDMVAAGSPLLNLNGEVVGIHTALGTDSDGMNHGGYVVPSNLLNRISRQLIDNGAVSRSFLGLGTQAVDSRLAQQLGLAANTGALVNQVRAGSPAAAANIQTGDVIQKINGIPVANGQRLQGLADDLPIGQKVPIEIIRDGDRLTLDIVPAAIPAGLLPGTPARRVDLDTTPSARINSFNDLGVGVKELTPETTPQWARQSNARGVLIDTVKPGTPAADAGLKPGMVIEKVGKSSVATPADLRVVNTNWNDQAGVMLLVHSSKGSKFVIVGDK